MATNIQIGSRGTEVKRLQAALNSQGYKLGEPDGIFGSNTEKALKSYQTKLGVRPDGILGDWVAAKLYAGEVVVAPGVPSKVTKKKVIAITAGHSNSDPGAVNGQYREAFIAVEFRNEIAKRLRAVGYEVLTDGNALDNEKLNLAIVLAKKADLAIEFHLNASDNKTAKGVEALALDKDKVLCQKLCEAVARVLDTPVRGSDKGWKSQSSGQHAKLGFCSAGGIIMETFFISNNEELEKYFDRREALYDALAKVIIEYVK